MLMPGGQPGGVLGAGGIDWCIRDYINAICNVRQCVFHFRDRAKSQKTLVKAEQL